MAKIRDYIAHKALKIYSLTHHTHTKKCLLTLDIEDNAVFYVNFSQNYASYFYIQDFSSN